MNALQEISPELMLMQLAADCSNDPLAFARGFWPDREARNWQVDILNYVGEWLSNPETRFQPCRIAIASGHGIGKSALIGMLLHWGMSTCIGCKCVITAGKGEQLATKTVPEVTKWFKSSLGAHWFECHAQSIRVLDAEQPENWRADFVTWSKDNTQTFAGVHNEGKRIIIVFDEASTIDDEVWDVTNGALTDENTEIIWLAFGQPSKNTGRFRECFGSLAHRWKNVQIDSRKIEGTNKKLFDEWVEDYGEDSDYVRVRVRGEFPRAGSNQFIPGDVVSYCRSYKAESYASQSKVLSVDVARFGDDQSVLMLRHGRKAQILAKLRGLDNVQVADRVMEQINLHSPDAVVVDGDGTGTGVVDYMKKCGYHRHLFEFHGGAAANDAAGYFNRRAEIWGKMRDWLKAGAEIPDDPELAEDLTNLEYGFSNKQQIQLEKKDDLKKRGLRSPDCGDALAMSFHVDVLAKPKEKPRPLTYPGERSQAWMG